MEPLRYLVNFDSSKLRNEHYDVIIIGSGIAGVYTALRLDSGLRIVILTKESIDTSNSVLAQGGIAVSLDKEDSPELHFKDTLYAGAGLCDEDAVWVLVNEAATNIAQLIDYKVKFDKTSKSELAFTREAAHSKNRIIHAGDSTGKEVLDKLITVVKKCRNVKIMEQTFVIDILTNDKGCRGVLVYSEMNSEYMICKSNYVICAMGGYGQLYKNTTNPEVATGDGACMAYRAGADLMDLEFIQFHPTVLFHADNKEFLISEAVRGEGALLRNKFGERFMPGYHELAELAPRDIVSRAIFTEMKKTGTDHVYLDITFKSREYLKNRFPTIYKTCKDYGIDIAKDYIPVAPAEHYCMGGVKTDVFGKTSINGFFAIGEVACNGIHGANRLASNSLLEGLVFGARVAAIIEKCLRSDSGLKSEDDNNTSWDEKFLFNVEREKTKIDTHDIKNIAQRLMTDNVGIMRNENGLKEAETVLLKLEGQTHGMENDTNEKRELQNIVLLSRLVVQAALLRKESRGAHFREDFTAHDDTNWKRNLIVNNRND